MINKQILPLNLIVIIVYSIHNANGNMTSAFDWNYIYNGENQLVQASDGTSTINYEYNVNGLRTKKSVEGEK